MSFCIASKSLFDISFSKFICFTSFVLSLFILFEKQRSSSSSYIISFTLPFRWEEAPYFVVPVVTKPEFTTANFFRFSWKSVESSGTVIYSTIESFITFQPYSSQSKPLSSKQSKSFLYCFGFGFKLISSSFFSSTF